jgi:AraC-like DNA-binding protein
VNLLSRPAPSRELYEAHFGCPVRFGAANAMVFHAADLDRPFLTHNADLLGILAPRLDSELADRVAEQDVREQVKAALRRLLVGRRPELGDVARELAASPRTLQRRLADLGASFHQVLEESRRAMARQYLLHSSLELSEIAYLLGYEDANSFFRAFTRWEGMPPRRWRDAQRAGGVAPSPPGAGRRPSSERRVATGVR